MGLAARVATLSDFVAVAACQELAAAVIDLQDYTLVSAADELPDEVTNAVDADALIADLDERYHVALPPDVSVPIARSMLRVAATDATLAPILERILDAGTDTKQFALEVLSLGAAISLVICAATITKGRDGWGKQVLAPDLAKALGEWLGVLKPWIRDPVK